MTFYEQKKNIMNKKKCFEIYSINFFFRHVLCLRKMWFFGKVDKVRTDPTKGINFFQL